jgi:peptide-methionine (S)-S-oxide reductase
MLSHATFALGCFCCSDAQVGSLPGVFRTRIGYCGGATPVSLTYKNIGDHLEELVIFAEDEFRRFHFRRNQFLDRKSFKAENNRF